MRILLFANNLVGWKIAAYLTTQSVQIVGLVMNKEDKAKYIPEIISTVKLDNDYIFCGSILETKTALEAIEALHPDIGISVYFGHIIKQELIDIFPKGIINLHPSYLPYNRGSNPNIWSIIDETPAGATLHYVDSGVDTGDIIAQTKVGILPIDTGETLYGKLETACIELFKFTWPSIMDNTIIKTPQTKSVGTCHRKSDLEEIDFIDLDRCYNANQLLNIIRARTFPPHLGSYVVVDGKKIYLQLQLKYEHDDNLY